MNKTLQPQKILDAMKADSIPAGEKGLFIISKHIIKKYLLSPDGMQIIPPGKLTKLSKITWATIHQGGECVMADYESELRKHLEFVLKASGSILVTGLGLGCVIRGLLCKEAIISVDIVEKNQEVIDLVWPHMPQDARLHLHKADALKFNGNGRTQWDYGWHDIWTEGNRGLQKKHISLIMKFMKNIRHQGAWNFPKEIKLALKKEHINSDFLI